MSASDPAAAPAAAAPAAAPGLPTATAVGLASTAATAVVPASALTSSPAVRSAAVGVGEWRAASVDTPSPIGDKRPANNLPRSDGDDLS